MTNWQSELECLILYGHFINHAIASIDQFDLVFKIMKHTEFQSCCLELIDCSEQQKGTLDLDIYCSLLKLVLIMFPCLFQRAGAGTNLQRLGQIVQVTASKNYHNWFRWLHFLQSEIKCQWKSCKTKLFKTSTFK